MNIQSVIFTYLNVRKEASGYDIAKYMSTTTGNSHQQIYRTLGVLESQGYLVHTVYPQEGKPDRKVYTIADQAKVANWLTGNTGYLTDFSKTPTSYTLACLDLKSKHPVFHSEYIKAMKKAEADFLASHIGS
jgi:PadR family transcriptional regulator AphA